MILQLGALFSSVLGGAPGASLGSVLGSVVSRGAAFLAPIAIQAGAEFTTGLINRELNRSSKNDFEAAIKARLRAAANAVSPTAAPGQGPVYSGGPATGSAFDPATLLPPSIQPPQRILQTDPNFFGAMSADSFRTTRRPPDAFVAEDFPFPGVSNAGLGSAFLSGLQRLRGLGPTMRSRAPGVAAEVGVMALDAVRGGATGVFSGSRGGATGVFNGGAVNLGRGIPLQINGGPMAMDVTTVPTGLPRTGNFQREANGCFVQWYFWDGDMGTQPQPIERSQAACLKRDCIYRLNVFTSKFVKLKGRRMNPMNVRAFFRAGRRVDSGERICRKMFSEHRKTKTGTVRRKRSRKKK